LRLSWGFDNFEEVITLFFVQVLVENLLRTSSKNVSADLGGVQVVVDESFDDGGELAGDQQVAGGFKSGDELSQGMADFLDKVNDLLLGGVAGDEVVQVSHDVHTDVAGQLVARLGRDCGSETDKEDQDLHDVAG